MADLQNTGNCSDMDFKTAEEIGRIYSEIPCNHGSFGEVLQLLYKEIIRQREYIEMISQDKFDLELELDYCIKHLEEKLEARR